MKTKLIFRYLLDHALSSLGVGTLLPRSRTALEDRTLLEESADHNVYTHQVRERLISGI